MLSHNVNMGIVDVMSSKPVVARKNARVPRKMGIRKASLNANATASWVIKVEVGKSLTTARNDEGVRTCSTKCAMPCSSSRSLMEPVFTSK
eukprot:6563341-Pyramimonas_sp.AAC.1